MVVLMGDNFNARHNHSSVINEFVEFLQGFGQKPVHIICGNHERYGMHTALDFLQKLEMPNWHVYTTIQQGIQLGSVNATFIPYTTPAMLGVDTKQAAEREIATLLKPADISFAHHAITGTKGTEFFSEVMLDKNLLAKTFGMSFGGHVHKPERLGNTVIVTGNIFTQEVGEERKMVWMWDSITNTTLEVPLPVRGIYKVTWESQLLEMPDNSIVKCYVTDKNSKIDEVKAALKRFDAGIIIEQYPSEREKVHFEDGGLDLSIEGLLQMYAKVKNLDYNDVKEGFELIK